MNDRTRFDTLIDWTLSKEGGFVDHPSDPGGATNFGISLRFLRGMESGMLHGFDHDGDGDLDADDMRALTIEQAKELYFSEFWYAELDELAAPIHAGKLFDMGVNMGKRQAARIFQTMVSGFNNDVAVDGHIGNHTIAEANKLIRDGKGYHSFRDLCAEQARFYYKLVDAKRSREVFLLGWLRRAYDLPG